MVTEGSVYFLSRPRRFGKRLQCFFADFSYELNAKTERHYHVVFYLIFKLLG